MRLFRRKKREYSILYGEAATGQTSGNTQPWAVPGKVAHCPCGLCDDLFTLFAPEPEATDEEILEAVLGLSTIVEETA